MESNSDTRKASGSVDGYDNLAGFLYLLMRDHLPTGTLESIMLKLPMDSGKKINYTNGWLAKYAMHISSLLMGNKHEMDDLREKAEFYRRRLEMIRDTMVNEEDDDKMCKEIFEDIEYALNYDFIKKPVVPEEPQPMQAPKVIADEQ